MSKHYCDKCGKEMERTAKCEFYCRDCDNTIFDFSLQYEGESKQKRHMSDFELADFCRGGDLTEDQAFLFGVMVNRCTRGLLKVH